MAESKMVECRVARKLGMALVILPKMRASESLTYLTAAVGHSRRRLDSALSSERQAAGRSKMVAP